MNFKSTRGRVALLKTLSLCQDSLLTFRSGYMKALEDAQTLLKELAPGPWSNTFTWARMHQLQICFRKSCVLSRRDLQLLSRKTEVSCRCRRSKGRSSIVFLTQKSLTCWISDSTGRPWVKLSVGPLTQNLLAGLVLSMLRAIA